VEGGDLVDAGPDLGAVHVGVAVGACGDAPDLGLGEASVSALASGDAAVESGADAFLQKPVDPLQFVSTVRDLLGTSAFLRRQGSLR